MIRPQSLAYVCTLLLLPLVFLGCGDQLADMNEDPTAATELEPEPRMTQFQLEASGGRFEEWRANLIHASCMIQHLSSPFEVWSGCRYTENIGYIEAYWDVQYGSSVQTIEDVMHDLDERLEEEPDLVNLHAATRIMRVFMYQRLTDLYGDIPYSEAGRGFIDGNSTPAFDPQEEIYMDMLNELSEAVDAFEPGARTYGSHDLLFGGDVEQWRRYGNSMMLRLGMRLSEVDPATAEDYVAQAIEGGVMESNDDIAYIDHQSGPDGINRYGVGEVFEDFWAGAGHGFRISDTLMDKMLDAENDGDNIDPRVNRISALYEEDDGGDIVLQSEDPADFAGLPNGLTSGEVEDLDDPLAFNIPHRDNIGNYEAPNLWMSYAEVEFLLAEAALRGWGNTSSAQEHYENGIRAAMEHMTIYGADPIPDEEITSYIDNAPEASMETVLTQKWKAFFTNGYEAWSEWRRTGYPELDPVDFPGNVTGGEIPRRLKYPAEEEANNRANYEAALDRQGPDELTTRMWWDVE